MLEISQRITIRFLATVFVGLMITGCVPTSENPIGSAEDPKIDDRLWGVWTGYFGDTDNSAYMHVVDSKTIPACVKIGGCDPDDEVDGPTAPADLLIVARDFEDPRDSGWGHYAVSTAEINGSTYMSALWVSDTGQPLDDEMVGYHLLRYELTDDALKLFVVSEEVLDADVTAGLVDGIVIGESVTESVRLTASSEDLNQYIGTKDPKILFPEDEEHTIGVFARS